MGFEGVVGAVVGLARHCGCFGYGEEGTWERKSDCGQIVREEDGIYIEQVPEISAGGVVLVTRNSRIF